MSSIDNAVGQWGILKWALSPIEDGWCHPDDTYAFDRIRLGQKVCYCEGVSEGMYLIIRYGEAVFRVNPVLYWVIEPLDFYINDAVVVKDYPERLARIYDVTWHYKRGEPMFWLFVDGKKKSRRYFSDELARKI